MAESSDRNNKGVAVDRPLLQRIVDAAAYLRTGQMPDGWFGPGEPMKPVAQESEGRRFDYAFATNTIRTPKFSEGFTFEQLRSLADLYAPLRLVIESRKDQMAKLNWTIKYRDKKKKQDKRCFDLIAKFQSPDGVNDWESWLRLLVEDLLVIDAPTVYPRLTMGGDLYAFEPVDGATIKVVLDVNGRRPLPPDPAYQQYLKGMAASNYTSDELIYRPRNIRTNRIYGYSPVEQVADMANIGLRRQLSQLAYFTDGTVPDSFMGVPDEWTVENIKEFQDHMDLLMKGNQKERRAVRMVSKSMADSYKETKAPPLKDQFDEWIMRIIAYAFSIDVTPFVAQVNRATAETQREQSLEEGLVPLMNWVKSLVNLLLAKYMNATEVEFDWEEEEEIKPVDQATVLGIYVDKGIITSDEAREKIGMEPMADATDDAEGSMSAKTDIQQTALNGTQVTSMQAIVAEVASKNLPPETAKAMLQAAFPATDPALFDAMLTPLKNFEKPEPTQPVPGQPGSPTPLPGDAKEPAADGAAPPKDDAKKAATPDVFVDVGATTVHVHIDGATQTAVAKREENS